MRLRRRRKLLGLLSDIENRCAAAKPERYAPDPLRLLKQITQINSIFLQNE